MDLISILLIVAVTINVLLASIVFFQKTQEKEFNFIFSLVVIDIILWSVVMFLYRLTNTMEFAEILLRLLYAVPIFMPVLILYFSFKFTKTNISSGVRKLFTYITNLILLGFLFLLIFTDKFIQGVIIPEHGEKIIEFGSLYLLYILHFLLFFGVTFFILGKKFSTSKDTLHKKKILYLFLGVFTASTLGMITNLLLPWFGYFVLNWFANFVSILFVGFIVYAIIKFKLFNLKVVLTEILVLSLWIFIFARALVSVGLQERIINWALLFILIITGVLLIRSVNREVETREEIEGLAKDLEKANVRLKELDRLKSEFVAIASHQLRSPLTSIKGYASLILEGSFGEVSKAVKEAVKKIFDSSALMVISVQDFLDVYRIEQGKMAYHFEIFDIKDLLNLVTEELRPTAAKKGLALSFKAGEGNKYSIKADYSKIKQVLYKLIDN